MESSVSASIVNNSLVSIIIDFNFRVFLNLALYSVAATAGVVTAYKLVELVFNHLLNTLHFKWVTKFKDRRSLAIEVIKICTEGSTHGWSVTPRNIEYVYFISRLIERQNRDALAFYNELISSWNLNSLLQNTTPATQENVKFCQKLQSIAKDATDNLLKVVNKW
ncbi:TPA: hypothetical protein DIU27_01335 [Candidatus Collierbacteria bacterium]|uniref:Uncharacterized protein n=1 Tax=Candidatus Collierbacteria bacterium GW2011_GWB2_44_22 TaxID=1618387 RepID=A0A0G1I000_9BACT|nr:MAG: hypothetical protein UW31_C0015G0018 [Candidatus Collierbacteria bacterium GW2011_GWA2_44_13]KKT52123.1 MAG: hypothetical protein UW44_C0004G0028 [Candidatus Collierbacteria bacterium GW2011_GWB2_44_22]KKT61774.1 MAG: hypothetical protein UW56_C0018G0004 [Candidatus Collierbacteria bacterium GW2011_GWD1_44_27]KKT65004.1 MAG: hypothetical protein UW58_C0032G0007 [Candidatus Collierbacteria bacterium GW2011_GWC2_44_30]KKT68999.1 MAG: hypothetical protein UW64_C0006G0055 [Microgenomates gr